MSGAGRSNGPAEGARTANPIDLVLRVAEQYLVVLGIRWFVELKTAEHDLVGCRILAFDVEQAAQIRPAAGPEVMLRAERPPAGRDVVDLVLTGAEMDLDVRCACHDFDSI